MIIARNTIAILLETNPNNIKSLKQVDRDIYIQLRDSDDEFSMTIEEYQSCLKQLRQNKGHIDRTNFMTIAAVIGIFVFAAMSSINTNIVSNENGQSHSQLITE